MHFTLVGACLLAGFHGDTEQFAVRQGGIVEIVEDKQIGVVLSASPFHVMPFHGAALANGCHAYLKSLGQGHA